MEFDLGQVLDARLRRPRGWAHRDTDGAVVIRSTDSSHAFTVRVRRGEGSLERSAIRAPKATVAADLATLRDVFEGNVSGLEAFYSGALSVRGNIGLALKLDLFFPPTNRPRSRIEPGIAMVDGIETFYLEAGPRDAPKVVLLHGLGATNVSMLPVLIELAKDHHVIAPDMPGFGESGKPSASYDFEFFARWLRSFVDVLHVDRATVIGNSLGGRVALEFGLRSPDRCERLVLLCPSMAWHAFRALVPVVRLFRPELAAVPWAVPQPLVVAVLRGMFSVPDRLRPSWADAAADEFVHSTRTAGGRVAFLAAARQIFIENGKGAGGFWNRLEGLSPPSLFIWGERDPLVPVGFALHTQRALPSARSIVLEDCGHVPQFETMERAAPLVREFFGGTRM